MLVDAKMFGNHTAFNRPGQAAFVLSKIVAQQFLFGCQLQFFCTGFGTFAGFFGNNAFYLVFKLLFDAALFAFSAVYQGDRILALMAGLIGMVDAAFEHKNDFYVLDNLDEQKLYNCARNIEIAVWKMSSTRNVDGGLLLVSNELDPNNPNLSFEREFGRIIGLLDFLAKVVADKHGRSITRLTQSIATAVFLPVGSL